MSAYRYPGSSKLLLVVLIIQRDVRLSPGTNPSYAILVAESRQSIDQNNQREAAAARSKNKTKREGDEIHILIRIPLSLTQKHHYYFCVVGSLDRHTHTQTHT